VETIENRSSPTTRNTQQQTAQKTSARISASLGGKVRIHQSRILSIALFDQGEKNSTIKTNQSSIYQSGAVW
jgi:hypothetical protein